MGVEGQDTISHEESTEVIASSSKVVMMMENGEANEGKVQETKEAYGNKRKSFVAMQDGEKATPVERVARWISNCLGFWIAYKYLFDTVPRWANMKDPALSASFFGIPAAAAPILLLLVVPMTLGGLGMAIGIPTQEFPQWLNYVPPKSVTLTQKRKLIETLLLMDGCAFMVIMYGVFLITWRAKGKPLTVVFALWQVPLFTVCRFTANKWSIPSRYLAKVLFYPWMALCALIMIGVTVAHFGFGEQQWR